MIKIKRIAPHLSVRSGQSIVDTDDVVILRNGLQIPDSAADYGDTIVLSTVRMINGIVTRRASSELLIDKTAPLRRIKGKLGACVEGKFRVLKKSHIHEEELLKPSFVRRVR